jgi:hypothetical protein
VSSGDLKKLTAQINAEATSSWMLILGGDFAVPQAAMLNYLVEAPISTWRRALHVHLPIGMPEELRYTHKIQ